MTDLILFPSDFFDTKKVDADLQKEYDAVLATGYFDVALFGYESWFDNGRLILTEEPAEPRNAIYRGWMMQPDQYRAFYDSLREHNITLVTPPDAYDLMHVFPNVYHLVEEDTARMEVFYKYRGGLLTGGICIKEYLDLKHYGERTNEYRVFYINHEIATVCRNSGQGNYTPEPPASLIQKYRDLASPYYTVDYAELDGGSWRVIEAGDGEVSGLSDGQDYEQYFRALYHCFN